MVGLRTDSTLTLGLLAAVAPGLCAPEACMVSIVDANVSEMSSVLYEHPGYGQAMIGIF